MDPPEPRLHPLLAAALATAKLSAGAVHVWTVLASDDDVLCVCQPYLSPDEVERANRFRLERDRRLSILSRGFRRLLLGHYAGLDGRSLCFVEGLHGKPRLVGPTHPSLQHTATDVRFNVSHSECVAVFAVADAEVGIDIEYARPDRDLLDVARGAFSPREQDALAALDPAQRTAAFYRCWTQKEAFIKLVGMGLHMPLDAFDVEVDVSKPPSLLDLCGWGPVGSSCAMCEIPAPSGYVTTLATARPVVDLRLFSVP